MTIDIRNNNNLNKNPAPDVVGEQKSSFFTLDFEKPSVSDLQEGNIASKKIPEKSTQDKKNAIYTDLTLALKHAEVLESTTQPQATSTLGTHDLQYSASFSPNRSPDHIPQIRISPQFQNSTLSQQHSSSQKVNPMYYSNNVQRQPNKYYSDRPLPAPPLLPQNMAHRPLPPSPPQNDLYRPLPQLPQSPTHRSLPPPPPMCDTDYLADISLPAANNANKNSKHIIPFIQENSAIFQENNKVDEAQASLDLAKLLVDRASQVSPGERDSMFQEAQKIVKKLANSAGMGKQGYPEAQFYLANCYGTGGMGLTNDPEKAFSLYVQGSKQGHPGCTFRAAVCYEVGAGTKRDKNHAIQFYKKAANLGETTAMYKLGMILLKGYLGQPKNPREGIFWLKRAAQIAGSDHPHALHELGLCFESDALPSVIPDLDYARELFTQAAQFGYAPSQFKLGLAYENGFLNCPVDPRRSIAWYSKAAEQGDVEAEFALSGWYLTGAEDVLPQNDREAYLWARKAADHGSAKAEYAVGYYTETGTGVPQNLDEAKQWYTRAEKQNYRKATQRLTELKYGQPQQRRVSHTRDRYHTSSNSKECTIM